MTRDDINRLYEGRSSIADFLIAIGVVKVDEVKPKLGNSGSAVIDNGSIIIRCDIDALPMVIEGAWAMNVLDVRYKITDCDAFAKELVHALNCESENGTTKIHRMFDRAICQAIGDGAEGIEEHEKQSA